MIKRRWLQCFVLVKMAAISTSILAASEKTVVPLFLFSGQSNMVCLGSSNSDLPAAEKNKTYENIKIHSRADNSNKKWSTLGPGFGADASHFGPELYFGKVLSDSMPGTKIAFIKDASSGTYLGKKDGWLPPSSGGPGTLYKNMMTHIDDALKTFKDAFDTSKYTPRWAGFIWLQGEFDGWNDQSLANKYEENLTNLIKDIREKADDDSMPVIIPMISGSMWQYINTIHAAEIAVTQKLVNTDTMNTKGFAFSTDNVHFNAASQIKIGSISAQRWLAMKYCKNWWTPTDTVAIIYKPTRSPAYVFPNARSTMTYFDISGRMIRSGSIPSNTKKGQAPTMLQIGTATLQSGLRYTEKTMNLR